MKKIVLILVVTLLALSACELQQNSENIPSPHDFPLWSSSAIYSAGDEVSYDGWVFQSTSSDNVGNTPCAPIIIVNPIPGTNEYAGEVNGWVWNSGWWTKQPSLF
jgi:hypothetical protein